MLEEESPPPRPRRLQDLRLDGLGVAELESYRAELQAEILRVAAEIGRKQGHRSAADAVFRRG